MSANRAGGARRLRRPERRRQVRWRTSAGAVAALLVAAPAHARVEAGAGAEPTRTVTYRGYSLSVPRS